MMVTLELIHMALELYVREARLERNREPSKISFCIRDFL